MKAGAFGRAPERRQVQPGGRVLPGMFASAPSSSPQPSSSAPANKPAATPSAVMSRWGSGEGSGSGRFGGSPGANGSSRLDRLARARVEGLSGPESASEDRPQPKSLASSDSIARARRLGLNRRARTPSPEPEVSEEEYERSPSPPPVRRQRAQSTSASAFTRTRPQSRAGSRSPPPTQHRRRASSPPPVAPASRIPSPPLARESTPPSQTAPEQPAQGFLGSLWGRASQLVSGATGAAQANGVKEITPARKDSVTSDMPVPESHVTPFEAAARGAEEENRKPTRPLVVPPLVAAALAPHEAASVQPALLRTQSAPNPTVSPITYHRPTSLHARDSQRSSTSRFRSQPTPFDWLDPHSDLPLEPYLFLRTGAEKATRRGGAGRAARAPRPISAIAADQAHPSNAYTAAAAAGGMAGAASAGLVTSPFSAPGHAATTPLHAQAAFAPPPLVPPHFVSTPPPAFAPAAPAAPMAAPPPPSHQPTSAPPIAPPTAAAQPQPAPQLYAPAVAAAMSAAPPAPMVTATSFAAPDPPPLVAPAWQPVSQVAQPAPVESHSTAEAAAEPLPGYAAPAEQGSHGGATRTTSAAAGRLAASGTAAGEGEPVEPALPRSAAGPDSLPDFPAPASTAAPPSGYPTTLPTSAAPISFPSYGPPIPPSSSPHPPQGVPQPTAALSTLPPLVPPASLSSSAAPAAAPAAVSLPLSASMPTVLAAPSAATTAPAPVQGGAPPGGPALPTLPSLSRLFSAAVPPTQPPASAAPPASKAVATSSPTTAASSPAQAGDLPPMPKPRPIPEISPPQPPVPPLAPSSSTVHTVQQPVLSSLSLPDPPVSSSPAAISQLRSGPAPLPPFVPSPLPPPLPPKLPGYAARQGANTPVPSSDAAAPLVSLLAVQNASLVAEGSTAFHQTTPSPAFTNAVSLASSTPLPPSPAPPSYETLPSPSSPPVLADSKSLLVPEFPEPQRSDVIDSAANSASRGETSLRVASIVVEPPTPIGPRPSLFAQESLPSESVELAVEGESNEAGQVEEVEPTPALQPLELGWSLPDLGSLAFSPIATSAAWDDASVALAEGSVFVSDDKVADPLPLPEMSDSPKGEDTEDGPDPLDEAFDAVTAFASSFAQADLARAAQDPNHTERTERWLQRQGVERRPLSVVQAASPTDEAMSRMVSSQGSLAPGIYRPQTAPPASVPVGLSSSTAAPVPPLPSTYSSTNAAARGVSLATSLARLAAVSERDSSDTLSAEPPSPLETSVGAVGGGQVDRPRALDGGDVEAGEGFWVQRKVERQVGKVKVERDEAEAPALPLIANGAGAPDAQKEAKSEEEEAAEVAALFANW
ncbi:hypothetical protein NBRC10512_006940 [Rhodotorula toruloides]|uniref:RHTO0S02e11738g1_1 n=2 Tax=Rhodotorula toruloides TaxID=5286 RepID=A0A061AR29_RHOTO|nr:uncharacterized protein RHTO_07256 [Rhodotorula toruloides NP11]EMS23522.1 hypothetical protein RHTO_07256 [Rhodotorula toruloides NP11]CDR37187.1 RHTO0S02e11738g1_1 [Rhodotorula toruloides]